MNLPVDAGHVNGEFVPEADIDQRVPGRPQYCRSQTVRFQRSSFNSLKPENTSLQTPKWRLSSAMDSLSLALPCACPIRACPAFRIAATMHEKPKRKVTLPLTRSLKKQLETAEHRCGTPRTEQGVSLSGKVTHPPVAGMVFLRKL
ncbi:MAG TPA: hypothetical protein VL094_11315 [Sphingomonadaceae bacterium]|nr:hypothetical protein [Sphingomonadaceae bacterium]